MVSILKICDSASSVPKAFKPCPVILPDNLHMPRTCTEDVGQKAG